MPTATADSIPTRSIASLGMYDPPSVASANDRFWEQLRRRVLALNPPLTLNRKMPLGQQWKHGQLFFSQTCGYPYITALRQQLTLLGTPTYTFDGCRDGQYSSFIVTKKSASTDLITYRGQRLAANSSDSLSGLIAMEITLAHVGIENTFFRTCFFSGSHINSMRLVASGEADICCIDAVTWALACQSQVELTDELQIIAQSPDFPALPYVTSAKRRPQFVQQLKTALLSLTDDPAARASFSQLGIAAIHPATTPTYAKILDQYAEVDSGLRGKIAEQFKHW